MYPKMHQTFGGGGKSIHGKAWLQKRKEYNLSCLSSASRDIKSNG